MNQENQEVIIHPSADNETKITAFIDTLFELKVDQSLELIQRNLSGINTGNSHESDRYSIIFLESFWNFFQSQAAVTEKADFPQALAFIQKARDGFSAINLKEFHELSEGLLLYYQALVEIRTLNVNAGLEKINLAKSHFENLDKYDKYFRKQIEAFEAESLYVSGLTLLMQLDYDNGRIALEKASMTSKRLAIKFFEKDSPEFNFFTGYGYIYSAISDFVIQSMNLNALNFEFFDYSENEAAQNSALATSCLSKSLEVGEVVRMNLIFAKGMNLLSTVVFSVGTCMYNILNNQPSEINFDKKAQKKNIANANKFLASIGEQGLAFIRLSKQIEQQLNNVSRYVNSRNSIAIRPVKKQRSYDEITRLVEKGKTEKALKLLLDESTDFDIFNDVIALSGRFSKLNREKIQNVILDSDFIVEESKITQAILQLLRLLKEEA